MEYLIPLSSLVEYSIALSYRKHELEQQMLMNLHKKTWTDGLKVANYVQHADETVKTVTVPPPLPAPRPQAAATQSKAKR